MKPIIQICFSLKTGLTMDELKNKMQELKTKLDAKFDDYEVHSCHLSRKVCLDAGFTTEVPDMFDEIFGNKYICEITEQTKAEAFANVNRHREELSKKADRLVILSGETVTNVALELQMFTENRVIVL